MVPLKMGPKTYDRLTTAESSAEGIDILERFLTGGKSQIESSLENTKQAFKQELTLDLDKYPL